MSLICCLNCFNDIAIKRIITNHSEFGRCYYCDSNNVAIIPIQTLLSNLNTTLEALLVMFEEDDLATTFIDILDNDFQIFNKITDKVRLKNDLTHTAPDIFIKAFKSINTTEMKQQWVDFKKEIIHENRFFPQTSIYKEAFTSTGSLYNNFQQLIEQLGYRIHPAEKFYRGRISEDTLPHDKMGKPPEKFATLGRANPYGISYLYLAQTKEICIKEIRPNNGDTISIAEFNTTKELNVIDLRAPREKISFLSLSSSNYIDILKLVSLLETFTNELSLPVLPNNSQREYIPTQFITEFFKTHGNLDGIIFNSSYGSGYNLVLFSDEFCIWNLATSIDFIKIKGINFEHDSA
ncbi:RES family NAD+ phosphorylase [Acinetobacter defluvii]|uniref:RES family NAD+ phosphorylase n=1 Tax=Acinetobacter defluvii TaxID=1871111 RepID=UPI003AF7EB72